MEIWVFILTLWAIAHWLQLRFWRRKDDERFERVIDILNRGQAKIESIEKRIRELEHRTIAEPPAPPGAETPQAAPISPLAPQTAEPPPPSRIPRWPTEHKEAPATREPARIPAPIPPAEPAKPVEPVHHPQPTPPPVSLTPPASSSAPPPPAPAARAPESHPATSPAPLGRSTTPTLTPPPKFAHVPSRKMSVAFEQKLGGNWLNKIGITILVIGISLFLAIKFPSLTNPEKIALGFAVSLAILGTGIFLEKLDRYRIFARALIGGGWALSFFATYAMHFVPYTRVIETQWVDLVLLFAVAAVMVVHTLRYDSQVVTGLSFLLAFTTVTISQNTIYSLSAGVILALGLVAIVYRRSWFELEIFGILASYLNHFVWLTRTVIPVSGHHRMFPEFVPSCVLLCLYWAVYRWSYVARRIQRDSQETISTVAAILNTSLLLLLFKYQSVHPEWAFYALLILGATELAVAQLPAVHHRRSAFVILSSIGTVLLISAIPFRYSGLDMAIIWLAEAQILLIAGVVVREQLFRVFGFLVALLTAGDMLLNQGIPNLLSTLPPEWARLTPATSLPDYQLAFSFLLAAAVFYGNALIIPRRSRGLATSGSEEVFYRALSYLGAAMLFVGLPLAFAHSWTAVAWAVAAFAVLVIGRSLSVDQLVVQAHFFALSAAIRAMLINSMDTHFFWHTTATMRLATVPLIIALLYLCARWLSLDESGAAMEISELYTSVAAFLVVLLTYYECHWAWIGIAWGAFALALAALGLHRDRRDLSWQAHLIVLAGFVRTLLFNYDAGQEFGHFTLRLITFTSMAALLYLCAYFSGPRSSLYARLFSALHTFAASLMLAVLAFLEIASPWIAVSWALFALLLLVIGDGVKRTELHLQAYILSVLSLLQLASVNIYALQPFHLFPSVSVRLVTMAIVAALFYLCGRWAAMADFIPQATLVGSVYVWTGSFLVLVLLHYEVYASAIALGWAVFGLALFEFGVLRRSLNWRLQGYATFALAFVRLYLLNPGSSVRDLRLYTLPMALIFYYVYVRLTRIGAADSARAFAFDLQNQAAPILAYLGSATLALFTLNYFRTEPSLIAWAALVLLFIAIAWFTHQDVFLHHSVILAFLLFLRTFSYELFARFHATGQPGFPNRVWYVAATCAIVFAGQAFAFPLRARMAAEGAHNSSESGLVPSVSRFLRRPEPIYFFIPMILVTFLILQEVSTGRVTIAWGIEAVVTFLFALSVSERSYRLAGLSLLLACVAKILVLDVWRQQRSDRYVTFIILGVALLLVSFLYTRYSETINRYL
jgi:Predicted membrane protein (DUF2339)